MLNSDMAMGRVNPWVGLGWVGPKIFIITVGWVGLGQGLCGTHIQRMLTAVLCIDITKIRNRP